MQNAQMFRWGVLVVFLSALLISGYFRNLARRSGEVISRKSEGKLFVIGRLVVAVPMYLSFLTYIVNPRWMGWSSLDLPIWLRWLTLIISVGMLPVFYWVMRSIGRNVSETFLTKDRHALVTNGPYRRVRHPLYSVATAILVFLSIAAANWFMVAMVLIELGSLVVFVVPREEAELIRKFGDEYQAYRQRTGRLTPRIFGRR